VSIGAVTGRRSGEVNHHRSERIPTMTTQTVTATVTTTSATAARRLLTAGTLAGPVFVVTYLAQAFTREAFDITRHPASLLANGDLGWIQTTNFVVSGALCIAAALGLRRTIAGRGRKWAPRLLAQYGAGLLLAALFPADPAQGFPAGTPADYAEISPTGVGHMFAGTIGFTGLIALCFVLASHYRGTGRTAFARWSTATGTIFALAFAGVIAGGGARPSIVAFSTAVILAWTWLAAVCATSCRDAGKSGNSHGFTN